MHGGEDWESWSQHRHGGDCVNTHVFLVASSDSCASFLVSDLLSPGIFRRLRYVSQL